MRSYENDAPRYGVFRGVVTDDADPSRLGRIRVVVPDVTGSGESAWAMPSVPFGSSRRKVPPVGANVWIQFEQGDPSRPVWTGTWWSDPDPSPAPPEGGRVDRCNIKRPRR